MILKCYRCKRTLSSEDDRREGWKPATWGSPGFMEEGCVKCFPDSELEDAARDAYWDRKIEERREGLE